MKHRCKLLLALLLAALALAGCAPRTTWTPLWSTPMPGRTPASFLEPTATPPVETKQSDPSALFASDVDKMDNPRIVVSKTRHTLEVYDGDTLMARMSVALGREAGAKGKSGDNKTPEGAYYICKTSDSDKFYKSLFISYPNTDDANKGLNNGTIDQEQYDSIESAIDQREQPLWDTDLGGEIAINGIGTGGKDKTGDWTAGNIAVSDIDMDYLIKYIVVGVDVEIQP